jgi:predicted membrane protein
MLVELILVILCLIIALGVLDFLSPTDKIIAYRLFLILAVLLLWYGVGTKVPKTTIILIVLWMILCVISFYSNRFEWIAVLSAPVLILLSIIYFMYLYKKGKDRDDKRAQQKVV